MRQTILFDKKPVLAGWASVAGKKESEGPLGSYFDITNDDDTFSGKNWEQAESRMQTAAVNTALSKCAYTKEDIGAIVAGDLLGQLMATSFGISEMQFPFLGVYGACSTMGESMAVASMLVAAGFRDNVIALTSSHFATAEKQFRFPLGYGNQRPYSATTTVTGSGAVIISSEYKQSNICIEGVTIGKIEDYGIKDANNMGAAMAPAAYSVIEANLRENDMKACEYSRIITGDLGKVGGKILKDMLLHSGIDIEDNYMDCGMQIYNIEEQDAHSGGSGCGCAAITLCGYILDKLKSGEWERVLFVPTGALLSTVSLHEGNTIPAIAHGIMLSGMNHTGK